MNATLKVQAALLTTRVDSQQQAPTFQLSTEFEAQVRSLEFAKRAAPNTVAIDTQPVNVTFSKLETKDYVKGTNEPRLALVPLIPINPEANGDISLRLEAVESGLEMGLERYSHLLPKDFQSRVFGNDSPIRQAIQSGSGSIVTTTLNAGELSSVNWGPFTGLTIKLNAGDHKTPLKVFEKSEKVGRGHRLTRIKMLPLVHESLFAQASEDPDLFDKLQIKLGIPMECPCNAGQWITLTGDKLRLLDLEYGAGQSLNVALAGPFSPVGTNCHPPSVFWACWGVLFAIPGWPIFNQLRKLAGRHRQARTIARPPPKGFELIRKLLIGLRRNSQIPTSSTRGNALGSIPVKQNIKLRRKHATGSTRNIGG